MTTIAVRSFTYDDLVFYYTQEAIDAEKDIIGFYFDRLGFPQSIDRNSLLGGHILRVCSCKK
jgi:hypothetical protein